MPRLLERRRDWLVVALLAAGFALRLGYGAARPPLVHNTDHYVDLGISFAADWSLSDEQGRPSAFREPAYPIVLGLLFKVFGHGYATVLTANCVLGVLMLWLMFSLGRALYGEPAGLVALAIGALYPPFLYYAAQPLRETTLAFGVVLSLWLLERAGRKQTPASFGAAGAGAAVTVLTKATLLPFALLLVPLGILLGQKERGRAWRCCAAYTFVFVALFGLWPLRNWWTMHRVIWANIEGGGSNLYQYLVVPQELGGTAAQTAILSQDPVFQAANQLDPLARDRALWQAGVERIRSRPGAYAQLVAWRFFWDGWRLCPRPRPYEYPYRTIRWVSLLSDGWIIPLAFLGILLTRLRAPGSLWLYLLVFSETFVYALIFSMIRYRFARMPVMILLASMAVVQLWTWAGQVRAGRQLRPSGPG